MTTPPATNAQNVCASDPNFAVIFAFCEQFGDNCGVTIPTFQELQEMLETTNEVPDALIDLHIKLLRRVKKSVHIDKWEKAIIKFCQAYSIPEFWELERYGYKGISVHLKLKILKTLFEAQFDSNVKFKAEINKLESSVLRPQPLGWDKSGIAYWVQFDKTCNLRVYKEDIDEDTWKIVAQDRNTLVKLINDLSGSKDTTLDDIDNISSTESISDTEVELSPDLDQEKHFQISDALLITKNDKKEQNTNESNVELENNLLDQKNNSLEKPVNLKRKLIEEDNSHNKINVPIVGEAIEECVMIIKGEGSGNECDTGNPDEINTQNDTTKNEDVKKPKLWSIETICSSSNKEVAEEIISVPTTGFFFGDDSVPCLNNVSNGESSHIDKNKLEIEPIKTKDEELEKNKKLDEICSTSMSHDLKECSSKNKDELSSKNTLKQSVFNIKVHEEEVQITERNANDVFTKSEFGKKDDVFKTNTNETIISADDIYSKSSESMINSPVEIVETIKDKQLHTSSITDNYNQNQIDEMKVDSDNIEVKYKVGNNLSNEQPSDSPNLDIDPDKQISIQDTMNLKSEEIIEDKIEQQLTTTIDDQTNKIVEHILDETTNEQLTSEIKSNYKVEQVSNSCEKVNENELTNPVVQCTDIYEQKNVDIVKQNPNILNKSMLVNIVDSDIINDNQIITDDCNVVDNKETKINLIIEDNENKQLPKDIIDHVQNIDYLKTNATCSNYKLNQQTKSENDNDNSKLCTIDYSSNSEIHDQSTVTNVNEFVKASNQINNDQNYKKPKITSHNISNIIETVSDSDTENKELSIINPNENIQLDNCKIKNQNQFVNLSQNLTSNINVDSQIISNNKHSLNKIQQKPDEIKKIQNLNYEEESTKDFQLNDKPEISNIEMEIKIDKEDSINTDLNTKNIDISNDLTIEKEYDEPKEYDKNNAIVNQIIHENQKEIIDTIDKVPKLHNMNDEFPTIRIKQCSEEIKQDNLEMDYTEITLNKIKSENAMCNNETMHDLYESASSIETPMVVDKENNHEIVKLDQNIGNESIENNDNLENKECQLIIDKDIKDQNFVIKAEKTKEEQDILHSSEEQIINSLVHEDIYESTDENNEETVIGSPIKEYNNSEIIDTTKIDDKIYEEEDIEETPKKRGRPGRKKGKRGKAKKNITIKQEIKNSTEEKVKRPYKPRQKKVTIAEEVTIFPEPTGDDNKRRSRRIAEIKIKEQFIPTTLYDDIDIPIKGTKKNDKTGKKVSTPSKKIANIEESDDEDEEDTISKKFKKRKRKGKSDSLKKLNVKNPWNVDSGSSSSENNIELFEDYDHEEEDEIPRPGIELNISDHEFSPESDINDDDEYLPEKRARTAHKKDQGEQLKDDMCQKCNKSDQPEWILLCDTCNQGWHASCLHPPLMVIPDGDWYCPPCRHDSLLNALKDTLKRYDGESKKRENEELRRKRLAYVGISLQNVISSKSEEVKSEKKTIINESSEENDDDEESESESYDSEPLYQLRARRQANVSYRFNDYDDMINEAILDETGIDDSAVRKSVEMKTDKNDNDEGTHSDNDNENDRSESPIAPALLHLRGRKKSKKLTNLDISSDDGSDEDFKGPSDGDDDYEEEDMSEYSDDSVKRRPQPTRRSVRNRKTVVDPDFINDDSSEESDNGSKKKRSRPWSDSSNSEEEDLTWGKKKKKRTNAPQSSSFSYKQSKGAKRKRSENTSFQKPKKSKIKYGMDSDSDFDEQSKRRTRARQITYAESDDSEVEIQTKKRKILSDEEDEYVLNDEELEAENEDHNLEVDDEDAVSNEEKDEDQIDDDDDDDDDNVELAINDNDNDEEEEEEEEEDNPKLVAIEQITAPKIPMKSTSTSIQSVIQEPTSTGHQSHKLHPRLLPPINENVPVANLQTSLPSTVIESPIAMDKRKRPVHQVKKSSSPNHKTDYGGSVYPCPPDATKVMSTIPQPSVHIAYNRLPTQGPGGQPTTTIGGFKSTTIVAPPSSFPPTTAYRNVNKIAATTPTVVMPPAYLQPPPQLVQQVYQTPPPSTNFSSYPIDYTAAGAPLPPPPPTIPFRNIVVAPPMTHEPLTVPQQSSAAAGGDSEFGGLVSYFSSQQEDDFDT